MQMLTVLIVGLKKKSLREEIHPQNDRNVNTGWSIKTTYFSFHLMFETVKIFPKFFAPNCSIMMNILSLRILQILKTFQAVSFQRFRQSVLSNMRWKVN